MSRKIIELYSVDVDGLDVLVGTDIHSRKLCFFVEKDGEIARVSDELEKKVQTKLAVTSDVLDDINELIASEVDKCVSCNESHCYPDLYSNENLGNLSVNCKECLLEESSAAYETFSNTMNLNLPSLYLHASVLNIQIRLILRQVIAHEVGHMTVSEIKIDDENVIASTGFLERKIPIDERLKTKDGDEYYRLESSEKIEENDGRGIEEAFNALETDERNNGSTAPNFANRLDKITEGKLRYARRNHSLDEYYEIMESIVPSHDSANILLALLRAYYKDIG